MNSNNIFPIYQSIKDTVKVTGLSEYFLRKQLAAGTLPSVRSGTKIFVNVPKLLEQLGGTENTDG